MKIMHLNKNHIIPLILMSLLVLTGFFFKMSQFFKSEKSAKKNIFKLIDTPNNQSMDPMEEFKSKLRPFANFKSPCWYEPPFLAPNMISQMKRIWMEQGPVHNMQTPNMSEFLNNIRLEWFLKRQAMLQCFPYFYILCSSKCIRDEVVDFILQHPLIKAPSKKDIDFWPNVLTSNIDSYKEYFEIPTYMINKNKDVITFDASVSTFYETNSLFQTNHSRFSNADFIHTFNKKIKVLVVLENPVSRLYADYISKENNSTQQNFHEKVIKSIEIFEKCLKISSLKECMCNKAVTQTYPVCIHQGIYWVLLERWCHNFSGIRLKLLTVEDYLECKDCFKDNIFPFLIQKEFPTAKHMKNEVLHNCLYPKIPMLEKTRTILEQFYSPYNKKLVEVSGNKDFLWN